MLSWKLCKGTKFSSVKNVLKLLKERLDRQGKNLPFSCWTIAVTGVKLDPFPFHAIQG